jgi:hypothetical protein
MGCSQVAEEDGEIVAANLHLPWLLQTALRESITELFCLLPLLSIWLGFKPERREFVVCRSSTLGCRIIIVTKGMTLKRESVLVARVEEEATEARCGRAKGGVGASTVDPGIYGAGSKGAAGGGGGKGSVGNDGGEE